MNTELSYTNIKGVNIWLWKAHSSSAYFLRNQSGPSQLWVPNSVSLQIAAWDTDFVAEMAPKKDHQKRKTKGKAASSSSTGPKLQLSADNENRLRRLLLSSGRPAASSAPSEDILSLSKEQRARRLRSVYEKLSCEGFKDDQIELVLSALKVRPSQFCVICWNSALIITFLYSMWSDFHSLWIIDSIQNGKHRELFLADHTVAHPFLPFWLRLLGDCNIWSCFRLAVPKHTGEWASVEVFEWEFAEYKHRCA